MRILVAYASKMGSTAEIAEAVAATLRGDSNEVDCVPAGEVTDLGSYDAVVLGSAVYAKRWRGDARHFLRKHRKALASKPFWVFSSGPVGDPADDAPNWTEPPKVVAKVNELGGRGHVVFGGSVPAEPEGFVAKSMAKNIPPEFRDRRDWDEIKAWAQAIAAELAPQPA
jgi:menaquinone-dependent protoporphyrinogen oxidase